MPKIQGKKSNLKYIFCRIYKINKKIQKNQKIGEI